MNIYQINDAESACCMWFQTKAEALKAFNKSGKVGHHITMHVYKLGPKKSGIVDFLNNVAFNTDCTIDDMDISEEYLEERDTHTCAFIKEKNGV